MFHEELGCEVIKLEIDWII